MKTKKNLKMKMKNSKRKTKNSKRKNNYLNVNNSGATKIILTVGKQPPKKTVLKWDGTYNGKKANLKMDLDVDGKKTHTNVELNNRELMNLIGSTHTIEKPIDERLMLLDEDLRLHNMDLTNNNIPVFVQDMPEFEPQLTPFPKIKEFEHLGPSKRKNK